MEEKSPWTIENGSSSRIVQHAMDIYPNEACGILLSHSGKPRHIKEVYPTSNVTSENQATRYLVDPLEFLDADKWAEEQGLDICGFYHSHPDHPSAPSEYDRKMAWEGYLYLIISVRKGKFAEAQAWIYDQDAEHFEEVMLRAKGCEGHHEGSSSPQ